VEIDLKIRKGLVNSGANVSAKEPSLFTTLGTGLVQRVAVAGLVTKTAVAGRQKVILEAALVRINV